MQAIEFLMELYKLSYQESPNVSMLRENIRILRSGEIEETNPILYRVYIKHSYIIEGIHNLALENAYHDNILDETIFFFGQRYLVKKLKKIKTIYINQASLKIALMAFLKLCIKLPNDQVPEELFKKAEQFRVKNQYQDTIQFYKIPSYGKENLDKSEVRAKMFIEKNMTMIGMSRELIFRSCGESIADEVYPNDKGKPLYSNAFQTRIEHVLTYLINQNQYCTEKQLLLAYMEMFKDQLKKNETFRYNQTRLKRCLFESLQKYNYKRVKSNAELKERYNINSKGYPNIIIKE